MCLSPETLILFNRKAVKKHGGIIGIRYYEDIDTLAEYVSNAAAMYGWDEIERICLAVYQIVKKHPFLDANKRTAAFVLLNCMKQSGYVYTDRPKDLANKIIQLAQTPSNEKEQAVLDIAYFLKARLQKTS